VQNYLADVELACQSGVVYPLEWRETRLPPLRNGFNIVREAHGAAIRVVSAYRDPVYNAQRRADSVRRLIAAGRTPAQAERESGVARKSQHMEGRALDICPASLPAKVSRWTLADYATMRQFIAVIGQLYAQGKLPMLGGFGTYPRWAHLDTRETDTLITWQGA